MAGTAAQTINLQAEPRTLKALVEEARRAGVIVAAPPELSPPIRHEILAQALMRSAAQARKWALESRGHWSLS